MSRRHGSLARRGALSLALAVAGTLFMAGTASAHVTPQDPQGPAGGFFTTAFKVGHGCSGEATTKVEIKMPEGVTSVAPQPVAGWTLSTTIRKLDPPIDNHGTEITETTDTVIWEGGSLPSDQLQMFWISMKLPDGDAGTQLYFPIIQTCGSTSADWIAIPKDGEPEPEFPAAVVTLVASGGGHGDDTSVSSDDSHGAAEPAVDDSATTSESSESAAAADDSSGSGSNAMSVAALVIALGALVLAGAGFARKSTSSTNVKS